VSKPVRTNGDPHFEHFPRFGIRLPSAPGRPQRSGATSVFPIDVGEQRRVYATRTARDREHHAGRVDLVVTDVVMPAMGGRELSHHVGRTGPATKIVFMSGYPGEMTIPADSPDTGLFFLAKPFAPRALADKVREALDSPKSTPKTP